MLECNKYSFVIEDRIILLRFETQEDVRQLQVEPFNNLIKIHTIFGKAGKAYNN